MYTDRIQKSVKQAASQPAVQDNERASSVKTRPDKDAEEKDIMFIGADAAREIDVKLMIDWHYSLDQLMEMAGLAVAQTGKWSIIYCYLVITALKGSVYKCHPPEKGKRVLVACGPGNNGKYFAFAVDQSELTRSRWRWLCCCASSQIVRI
jgi:hypothetical protein